MQSHMYGDKCDKAPHSYLNKTKTVRLSVCVSAFFKCHHSNVIIMNATRSTFTFAPSTRARASSQCIDVWVVVVYLIFSFMLRDERRTHAHESIILCERCVCVDCLTRGSHTVRTIHHRYSHEAQLLCLNSGPFPHWKVNKHTRLKTHTKNVSRIAVWLIIRCMRARGVTDTFTFQIRARHRIHQNQQLCVCVCVLMCTVTRYLYSIFSAAA